VIKYVAPLVIIFALCLPTPALATEPGSGIIEGQIVNGTEGGSSVANQEITLYIYQNDTEVDSITTQTDATGHFVFDGLSTDSSYSYQVRLSFQQVEYNSDQLSFADGETIKSTKLIVYDATTSDEAIKVSMAHTIIYVEPDTLWVTEYFLFANEADRTYIGSKEIATGGIRETLRFSLPERATELQPKYGLMECCIYNTEQGFVDTMPVLPGTKEIIYSYRIDYDSGTYLFSRDIDYPIVNYDFLIEGENSPVTSDKLVPKEPLTIDNTVFSHLSGTNIASGDTLVVQLSNLPGRDNQRVIIWVAMALVVLSGGFAFSQLLRKRHLQQAIAENNFTQEKQRLLIELAHLDDDFEAGKIPEELYRKLRAEKKSQLLTLIKGKGK
jgi:hypothetical protein